MVERLLIALSTALNRSERYALEILLSLSSLWAAWALFRPPSNFHAYVGAYLFVAELNPREDDWAVLLAVGGLSKIIGLTLCLVYREHALGLVLRTLGLGISGFWWTLFGVSALLGNPDTLTGAPCLLLGLSAWWTLIRFPAVVPP